MSTDDPPNTTQLGGLMVGPFRLGRLQVNNLREALLHAAAWHAQRPFLHEGEYMHTTALGDYDPIRESRRCSNLAACLPKHLPYDVFLYPEEWAVISRALRPEGSNPKSPHARRWYSTYLKLRRDVAPHLKHPDVSNFTTITHSRVKED